MELPPGVAGNELALGQCATEVLNEGNCSGSAQAGTIHVTISGGVGVPRWGVFNMKADNGHTNELGFNAEGIFPVHQPTSVRTNNDYGITNITPHIPNGLGSLMTVEAKIWVCPPIKRTTVNACSPDGTPKKAKAVTLHRCRRRRS